MARVSKEESSQFSRPSPRKYIYVPWTNPIPVPYPTMPFSPITCLPPGPYRMSSWEPPPPAPPPQISKLPTDVVSGIRAITHGHRRSQERYLFGLPAAAGAVFFRSV